MIAILAGVSQGCGSGEYVPVEGVVSVDGAPLTTGRIEFVPESGRKASAWIQDDGSYQLSTLDPGDGAKPGIYAVTITASESKTQGQAPRSIQDEGAATDYQVVTSSLVDSKYGSKATTPLKATVDSSTSRIDFNIED